jgi:hypothetical protein
MAIDPANVPPKTVSSVGTRQQRAVPSLVVSPSDQLSRGTRERAPNHSTVVGVFSPSRAAGEGARVSNARRQSNP